MWVVSSRLVSHLQIYCRLYESTDSGEQESNSLPVQIQSLALHQVLRATSIKYFFLSFDSDTFCKVCRYQQKISVRKKCNLLVCIVTNASKEGRSRIRKYKQFKKCCSLQKKKKKVYGVFFLNNTLRCSIYEQNIFCSIYEQNVFNILNKICSICANLQLKKVPYSFWNKEVKE